MQGRIKLLNSWFSEKFKKQREAIIGVFIMSIFIVASIATNHGIFAANNAGYGYGYSSDTYGYGYQYSDAIPSTPTNFACSGASSSQINCSWTAVTTTTTATAISSTEFGSYRLYRSESSISACSGTQVGSNITTQTTASASDTGLGAGKTYYYALCAFDSNSNSSGVATASATTSSSVVVSGGGGTINTPIVAPVAPTVAEPISTAPVSTAPALTGEAQVQQILSDASMIDNGAQAVADAVGAKRSLTTEQSAASVLGKSGLAVNTETIAFVAYGTPSTKNLGSGERAGVLNSYKTAYSKLPGGSDSETEWADVMKIGNGRWPSEKSSSAESRAKTMFKTVYKRDADMNKSNDNAAVTVMAYGLRPSNRNTNSEKAAITIYKGIFKKTPTAASEWDAMRAIAYSGAKR